VELALDAKESSFHYTPFGMRKQNIKVDSPLVKTFQSVKKYITGNEIKHLTISSTQGIPKKQGVTHFYRHTKVSKIYTPSPF